MPLHATSHFDLRAMLRAACALHAFDVSAPRHSMAPETRSCFIFHASAMPRYYARRFIHDMRGSTARATLCRRRAPRVAASVTQQQRSRGAGARLRCDDDAMLSDVIFSNAIPLFAIIIPARCSIMPPSSLNGYTTMANSLHRPFA